jgi:hypothetical protein
MVCLILPRRVHGQSNAGRNCATQSKMCAAKESRGYLSARSSTRCLLAANCSIASPVGITLVMRKFRSSKSRSVSNKSLRNAKEPDLERLSTTSPDREWIPTNIPAVGGGAAARACRGRRGGCGREEEDGRKGLPHHEKLYESFRRSSGPCCVCLVSVVGMVVQISQQTRKITDRVSVICPHCRERLTFVGQDAVGWQHARPGR